MIIIISDLRTFNAQYFSLIYLPKNYVLVVIRSRSFPYIYIVVLNNIKSCTLFLESSEILGSIQSQRINPPQRVIPDIDIGREVDGLDGGTQRDGSFVFSLTHEHRGTVDVKKEKTG